MSRSLIYTSNETTQALTVGSTISLGNVIRRFGPSIKLNGNAINVCGAGYYNVSANVTVSETTPGTVTISLLKDGTQIPGAIGTAVLADGDIVTIPINAVVREYNCCMDNSSNLTLALGGTAESVTNVSVVVAKE